MSRWSMKTDRESNAWVDVWTNGDCPGNGLYADFGGIGVFWGDNHPWNVSQRADGRTNNSCEIEAAICAIQIARDKGVRKLRINTDSEFLINCVLDWIPSWRNNGWRTPDGRSVKHKHELMDLDYEMHQSIKIFWHHVSAHCGNYENDMAQKLARRGARN